MKLDRIAQNESDTNKKEPIKSGKAKKKWEKGDAILNFSVEGKDYHINIYDEMIIDAENIMEMNKIATHACSDAVFWSGVCRKIKTKLDKFKEIDMKKYDAHTHKWSRLMCLGEGSKAVAADVNAKKIEAFSEELLPESGDENELKETVKWFLECAIKGYNISSGRDFVKNPVTPVELDQYFGMIYRDNYDLFEINLEFMINLKLNLEEQYGILDLVSKLMVDKRTTLISTVSNNIRSEQDLFGKDGYKTAISEFNKQLLGDETFKKTIKKIIQQN